MNNLVEEAENLARAAHQGQTDLSGKPYIEHIARVAERVCFLDDNVVAVAWLHDLIEDQPAYSLDTLRNLGFPEEVIAGVEAITQRPGEPLESYWTRVASNRIAWLVKLHGDMPDNNDPARRTLDLKRTIKIGTKYASAIEFFWTLANPTFPAETVGPV